MAWKLAVPDQILMDGRQITPAMRTWMELITRRLIELGGGGGELTIEEEGVAVGTAGGITTIDFVGATVTATGSGADATVTITAEDMGTYKHLFASLLTGSSATLYTGAASKITVVKSLWIANTSASAVTVTLYRVESGGSIGDNRSLMKTVSVEANSSYQVIDELVLAAGDTLRGLAGTTDVVNVTGSGVEFDV